MAKFVNEIDWSYEGGFGIPWNYEMAEKAREISARIEAGDKVKSSEVEGIREWSNLVVAISGKQREDPITYGWRTKGIDRVLKYWDKADTIVMFGGNRGGKTDILATIAQKVMLDLPDAEVNFWQENDKPEITVKIGQQKVYDKMPMKYKGVELKAREKIRSSEYDMTFRTTSGFTNNVCVLPKMHSLQNRGSRITFRSYSSFINSPQVSEGYFSDLELYDEEPPFELFKRGTRPILDKHGKRIWACTLVAGYGELAGFVLDGAITLESKWSDWLNCEIPLVQKSANIENCYIFYLPTDENPFVDFELVKSNLSGLTLEEKKVRAYGVPTKRTGGLFPLFSENVHVIEPSEVPTEGLCRYLMVDPAGSKPYAMIWYGIDKKGRIYIYREWPDRLTYGAWCEPGGKANEMHRKGRKGPAMKLQGLGYEGYVKLIKDLEKDETVVFRYMDPRGNKTVQDKSGETNVQMDFERAGMYFMMAQGENNIDPGIQRLNSYFAYDPNEPVTIANQPKLYISSACGNLIYSLKNHTGEGGYDEYTKDFIDLARYAVSTNPIYFDGNFKSSKNGYKQYY